MNEEPIDGVNRVTGPNPVRDERGYFKAGNTLAKGFGNPIAKKQYELRKKWLELTTEEEFLEFRKTVVEGMLDRDQTCLRMYAEIAMGKTALPIELSRADDASTKIEVEDTMRLVLAALERFPDAKSEVADALLRATQPKVLTVEVNADGLRD